MKKIWFSTAALAICLQVAWNAHNSAAEPPATGTAGTGTAATGTANLDKTSTGYFNIPLKTSGGWQYWGDEQVCCGWRIQRNCFTGHCRLLDADDTRRAWGTFEACQAALESSRKKEGLAATKGHVVILLHGLGGTRPMMESMSKYLREQGKFTVITVAYPSTRVDIDADAASLGHIIAGLPEAERIDLVAHSLGNIVVRRYLALNTDAKKGTQPDGRIKRIVMLAPPNHGAPQAEKLVSLDVTGQLAGPAARQVTVGWKELEPKLVAPACEFAVLAGGRGDEKGYNVLLSGDNDGVVTVESAKLAGARDFRVVPAMHFRFMRQEAVQKYTLEFLNDGYFETEQARKAL